MEDQDHAGKMGEGIRKLQRGKADGVIGMDNPAEGLPVQVHADSRETHGARRVHAGLTLGRGVRVGYEVVTREIGVRGTLEVGSTGTARIGLWDRKGIRRRVSGSDSWPAFSDAAAGEMTAQVGKRQGIPGSLREKEGCWHETCA